MYNQETEQLITEAEFQEIFGEISTAKAFKMRMLESGKMPVRSFNTARMAEEDAFAEISLAEIHQTEASLTAWNAV